MRDTEKSRQISHYRVSGEISGLEVPGPYGWSQEYSLTEHLDKLRAIATEHLTKLRKLVSHPQSVEQTHAVLTEHFGTFKLEPVSENGRLHYQVHGKVDFWGDRAVARTGGAGGRNRSLEPTIPFRVELVA